MAPNFYIGIATGVSIAILVIVLLNLSTGIGSAEPRDFDENDLNRTEQRETIGNFDDGTTQSVGTGGYGICLVGVDSPCNGDGWDDTPAIGPEPAREPEPTENTSTFDWGAEFDAGPAEEGANNSVSS